MYKNAYIKVKSDEKFTAIFTLQGNGIECEEVGSAMEIVCEDLVDEFINDAKPSLQPLFVTIKPTLLDSLVESKDDIINNTTVKEIINKTIDNVGKTIVDRIVD